MEGGYSLEDAPGDGGDFLGGSMEADESIRALQDTVRWQSLQEECSFFQLDIHLKEGRDLAIRDRSGKSQDEVTWFNLKSLWIKEGYTYNVT